MSMFDSLIAILPERYKKRWGLDSFEKSYVAAVGQRIELRKCSGGLKLLVQMPIDYYCLSLFAFAVEQLRVSEVSGLWHANIQSAPRGERLWRIKRFGRQLFSALDKNKWQALYGALGAKEFFSLGTGWIDRIRNVVAAHRIWVQLNSKSDVLNLILRGTYCGDLVYDTYLRYRVQPTVDIKDKFLRYVIAQALNAQTAIRKHIKKEKFDLFLTSYTSYVQHGMPAREALRLGVQVFSAGNLSQHFKALSVCDTLHTAAHWHYKSRFLEIKGGQKDAIDQARQELEKRFDGGIDRATFYMKSSAYRASALEMPSGIEGVVFLHDFFDSPHCHRSMLFEDFLEWARFTLNLIQKHRLPFAIKPHPNQLPESKEVVQRLQKEYPDVQWISASLSNKKIFTSGIKCGVSVYGTILHELVYHGIPAVAAGDHPHTDFEIAYTPTSTDAYAQALCNYQSLLVPKNATEEVLAFYYMHNIAVSEGLALNYLGKNLREIRATDSSDLQKFLELYPELIQRTQQITTNKIA